MVKKKKVKKAVKRRRKRSERVELIFRIFIAIVSGIVLGIWRYLVAVLAVIHFIMVLFSGQRNPGLADFCEYWNSQTYVYLRYLTFESNEKPFPFSEMKRLRKFKK